VFVLLILLILQLLLIPERLEQEANAYSAAPQAVSGAHSEQK
jgi:hypothetical protein